MKSGKSTAWVLLGLVAVQWITACGKSPTAAATGHLLSQRALPIATQGGLAASSANNPARIMAAVQQASLAQQGFSATINTWERAPDGSKSTGTVSAWWKRPSTLKIDITKGDATSQGVTALWDGSDQMKVKPSYMPFAVSLPITDSRLISKNGWTIKDTDVSGMLNVLLDPAAQIQELGPQVIDGKSVFLLSVQSPKSPTGVTREQIGIDTTQNLPVVRLMYKGDSLIYKLVATTFKLGTPSGDDISI